MTNLNVKRWIEVGPIVKEGVHRYPAAETDPSLEDVAYLANEHFHYFYITVKIEVFHNDRCIEFQQFRRFIDNAFRDGMLSLDYRSCEMIAEDLSIHIAGKYPNRDMVIKVSEDNINGAILEFTKNSCC